MSNPYDDLFNEGPPKNQPAREQLPEVPIPLPQNNEPSKEELDPNNETVNPIELGKETLDEILDYNAAFNQKAEEFSKLLSELSAIDHKENTGILQYFVVIPEKGRPENLQDEKIYNALLSSKFERVIAPMAELANIHLEAIKRFNEDIDDDYYSIEQSDGVVQINKKLALEGINLQRKILADAAESLSILETALEVSEGRLRDYINTGGTNNISAAEVALLTQKRSTLTRGLLHQFDYSFFTINLLDKTALTFGVHLKETSAQYVNKLARAFEISS